MGNGWTPISAVICGRKIEQSSGWQIGTRLWIGALTSRIQPTGRRTAHRFISALSGRYVRIVALLSSSVDRGLQANSVAHNGHKRFVSLVC